MKVSLQICITAAFLFICGSAWSLEVLIAPVYQYSPEGKKIMRKEITEDLYRTIRRSDERGLIKLTRLKSSEIPKSVLEAASLSEEEGCGYLLYGFLKITDRSYDLEVKLYDRDAGRIAKIFYSKTGVDDYEELVETMSDRIVGYLYKVYGVERREKEAETEYGVIRITTGAGYWVPIGEWSEVITGIGTVYFGCSITPTDPLFTIDILKFSVSYGVVVEYIPGMSREGYEDFFLHTIAAGIPVELSALWHERNIVFLQVLAGIDTGILVQQRKYDDTVTERSGAFLVSAGAGYEYMFGGSGYRAGIMVGFDIPLYDSVQYRLSPSVYVRYKVR